MRADTVTHYLRLGPEASAQCQMGVGGWGLGQATGAHGSACVLDEHFGQHGITVAA